MVGGILGKKLGMTQVFNPQGARVPVTAIAAGPCTVLEVRTPERHGYRAVQVGFDDRLTPGQWKKVLTWYRTRDQGGDRRRMCWRGVKLPEVGHLLKVDDKEPPAPKRFVREIPIGEGDTLKAGDQIKIDVLAQVKKVDVIGVSKGRGFQGMIKRHGHARGPSAHGSKFSRRPGSAGGAALPGHTVKGHSMPGHMGDARVTVRNLRVEAVDAARNLLLVEGSIPGPTGGYVFIRPCIEER